MEDFFLGIRVTPQTIYLAIMLIVIGEGLKSLPFIKKWMVIWVLTVISILINFLFYGISFTTLFEAIIATAVSVFGYDAYKETKKWIRNKHS